jgi:DNA repair protein RecO (recombination protein O)
VKPRTYSDEGVVLARRSYSEADRILSVFSKKHGRVTLIAKGVRKLLSRKRGYIEIFSRIKFQAAKGKTLDIMTEAEIIDDYGEIRGDLGKVSLAYYFMEVVGRTTRENEENIKIYELILKYLQTLKTDGKLKSLRKVFVYDILTTLGFWPKGRPLLRADEILEEVTERQLNSHRVGKRLLS